MGKAEQICRVKDINLVVNWLRGVAPLPQDPATLYPDLSLSSCERAMAVVDRVLPVEKTWSTLPSLLQHAIVEILVHERRAVELERLISLDLDRAEQKLLKKAAHRLSGAGVSIERPPNSDTPEATRRDERPATTSEEIGATTPIDEGGDRMLWLTVTKGSRSFAIQAIVNDYMGATNLSLVEANRRRVRKLLKDHAVHSHWKPIFVPVDGARWIIRKAIDRAENMDVPLPEITPHIKQLLGPLPESDPTQVGTSVPRPSPDPLIATSDRLFELHEFSHWRPDLEVLRQMDDRLKAAIHGNEVHPGSRDQLLDRSIRSFFEPEMRSRYAQRLRDTAYLLLHSARPELAIQASLVAERIGDTKTDIMSIPFAAQLFRRLLQPHRNHDHDIPAEGCIEG